MLISDLVAQIRRKGERCVVYDKMGSYTRTFFDPARDVLLNPLDARAPRWSPFLEARHRRDFDMMAAALIPQQRDSADPFWVTAARQLFANGAAVFWEQGVTENRVLVDHLLKTDLTALARAMEGTVAQSIVDPDNPKTALSVRAMLTANVSALEFLPRRGRAVLDPAVGVRGRRGRVPVPDLARRPAREPARADLDLAGDRGQRDAVAGAGRRTGASGSSSTSCPPCTRCRASSRASPSRASSAAASCSGVQVASALRDLYGRNGAETISGLCGTRVVLAAPDRDTAQWSADSLGRSEIEEVSENVSYGANTIRDGVSLTPRRELRALALPADIMRLPNLHGYLKFPGPYPVASIRLRPVGRSVLAPRFVPREDHEHAAPGSDAPDLMPPATADGAAPASPADIADGLPWPSEPDVGWREPVPAEPVAEAETPPADGGNGTTRAPSGPAETSATPRNETEPAAVPALPRRSGSPGTETAPASGDGDWA